MKVVVWDSKYVIILHPPLTGHVIPRMRIANFAIWDWNGVDLPKQGDPSYRVLVMGRFAIYIVIWNGNGLSYSFGDEPPDQSKWTY